MHLDNIKALLHYREYPSVSILLRTHKTHPENEKDPIRLKDAIKNVEERLSEEIERKEVAKYVRRLEEMAEEIDHQHNTEGLVLYANKQHSSWHRVGFPLENREVIDETFATRDLLRSHLEARGYRLLTLNDKAIRLYTGYRDQLTEERGKGFPYDIRRQLNVHRRQKTDSHQKDKRKEHYNLIDKQLWQINRQENLPLVLAGVTEQVAMFKEIADRPDNIFATLEKNVEPLSVDELGKQVWQSVEQKAGALQEEKLEELKAAVGSGLYVSGLQQVWRQAHYGLGRTLFVEKGYRQAGTVAGEDNLTLSFTDDSTAPGVVDDLVDEVIETVISYGGDVVFVEQGALAEHNQIALILRG